MNDNAKLAFELWAKETKTTLKQQNFIKEAWDMWISACSEKLNYLNLEEIQMIFSGFIAGYGFGSINEASGKHD